MKPISKFLGALGLAIALTFSGVVPADAATASVSLTIVSSQCARDLRWSGENVKNGTSNWWPRGTVNHCVIKYRLSDSDKAYDYYMVEMVSEYTLTSGHKELAAEGSHTVTSSIDASGGVYGATKSYTSNASCSQPVTISVAVGPFSVAVSPTVCDGYSIRRDELGAGYAQWAAPRVGGVDSLETVFVQKVPSGKVPKFAALFTRPAWDHTKISGFTATTRGIFRCG